MTFYLSSLGKPQQKKYQFEGHDVEVVFEEGRVQTYFQEQENITDLAKLLVGMPQFHDVNPGAPFLPLFGSMILSPKAYKVTMQEVVMLDMMRKGWTALTEGAIIFYLAQKLMEWELDGRV